MAFVLVVFRNRVAAISTGRAVPVRQPAIGRTWVVCAEHLGHEQEKLSQSSLFQGFGDGMPPFAFTERIALDMRMADVVTATRLAGIKGDHDIGLMTTKLVQPQADFEWSQVNFFQDDPLGADAKDFSRPVEIHLLELNIERSQLFHEQPQRRRFRSEKLAFQVFCLVEAFFGKPAERLREPLAQLRLSSHKARPRGQCQLAFQPRHDIPVFVGQRWRSLQAVLQTLVLLFQIAGDPPAQTLVRGCGHIGAPKKSRAPRQ